MRVNAEAIRLVFTFDPMQTDAGIERGHMAKDQSQTNITDLVRQTQALLSPNGAAAPQIEQVMEMQEGMLKQAEAFNRHWIERRQKAVDTALEAMNEMQSGDKTDPAAAMRAIADWQRGSLERLTEDLQEWTAMWMKATQLAATAQNDAASSDDGKATKAKGQSASSGSKSDHATPV